VDPAAVYGVTSIGRPLDPNYPTNKAVLFLMPAAGIVAAAAAVARGAGFGDATGAGLTAIGAVFGSWALGRELAPDYDKAAFVSMALAFAVLFFVESPSLLLLFLALFLVRVVNRSVGLPARISDSVAVSLLTTWAVYSLSNPLLGIAAAVAFLLDAVLARPQRHQIGFAVGCLGVSALWVWGNGFTLHGPISLATVPGSSALLIAVGSLVAITLTRQPQSVGDATGELLSRARVRGGIFVGLLVALSSLAFGAEGIRSAGLVWATLGGILIWR